MIGIIVRTLVTALAIWVAAAILPGITIEGFGSLLLASLLLGFVNAVIRPIFIVLTLPITMVTLGFFLLVINAAMLKFVSLIIGGLSVEGFFNAVFGAIIVSIVSTIVSWFVGPEGRYEVYVSKRR